jgi:hypothetical protein
MYSIEKVQSNDSSEPGKIHRVDVAVLASIP